jgi:hypothetical protein
MAKICQEAESAINYRRLREEMRMVGNAMRMVGVVLCWGGVAWASHPAWVRYFAADPNPDQDD